MRTLLAAILLAVVIVAGVAIVVPLVARPMIATAVQAASPFGDQVLEVEVDSNVFGLLTGTVDRIRVRGADLRRGDVTVAKLDVTLTDVATSGRAFRTVDGTLALIDVPIDGADPITIDDVQLDRSSTDMSAVATLGHEAAIRLVQSAFVDAGMEVTDIQLGTGSITLDVFGARVEVPIGVEGGAIVLVDPFGTGAFEVVTPGEGDAWQFTGVAVTPGGMTIDARVDVERLLAPG